MKLNLLSQKYDKPISLALGFFDCIHIGHRRLIAECKNSNYETAIFTFSNDPSTVFGGNKQIYNFSQRVEVLQNLGVDLVISEIMDSSFSNLEPKQFLSLLFLNYDIRQIIVGSDYTFGYKAKGDINMLKTYCNEHNCKLNIIPFEKDEYNNKISSRNLKILVTDGNVEKLNQYLSEPYFVFGKVINCRHEGTILGYPTANISFPSNMLSLGEGVYATKIKIGNQIYNSMTNVGSKPTFDIDEYSIETFIFDFNQNIYDKDVEIAFLNRTRDIIKFESKIDLINKLKEDEKAIRELLG